MKFVKFSVLALALGFFAASCNNDATTETTATTVDTTAAMQAAPPVAPPAAADTMHTAAPAADTMHAATATKTEVKTEVKK